MDKKRTKKNPGKKPKAPKSPDLTFQDPRGMKKITSDFTRIIKEKNFNSLKDANPFLQDMISSGGFPDFSGATATPLDQAKDLMYEAWDSTGKRRIELALRAIEISKDCADAYVLLAEEKARDLIQAREYYELGVKAGERALGTKVFKNETGYFWGLIETRPYMRARTGLADCLWRLGERLKAIEHYEDMLRLNPNDNQGIRYILVNCLLVVGSDLSIEKLIHQYKNDIACSWTFSRALWIFRKEGPSHNANKTLKKAIKQNPFAPLYLLGKKKMPRSLPPYVGIGDENEAIDYAAESIEVWRNTSEALQWLALNHQTK